LDTFFTGPKIKIWCVILKDKYKLLQVSVGVDFILTCLLSSVKNHTNDNVYAQVVCFSWYF